jgi:uncharacterized membrane protein
LEFLVLGLLALAIPVSGVAGFFMALKLRRRTEVLEARIGFLEARLGMSAPPTFAGEPQDSATPEHETVPSAETPPDTAAADQPEEVPASEPLSTPPLEEPPPPRGFEERIGARWTVWVGGVALALGGLFLVRYSIELGLLGPGARVAAGLLFAAALIGGGEILRRREIALPWPGLPEAHVPGVLAAAGASTAFGSIYAAHALYGMIGPATAFALLGLVAVGTMVAAALHGPALAALGLLAALVNPVLIDSTDPQIWPVVIYLLFPVGAAYGLARLRLWRWLALAAAGGALIWGALLVVGGGDAAPILAHLLLQTALAALFLLGLPYRGTPDAEVRVDRVAALVLTGFAILSVFGLAAIEAGAARAPFAGLIVALLTVTAVLRAPGSPTALLAALVVCGALIFWPVAAEVAGEPASVFSSPAGAAPTPAALVAFLMFAVLASLGVAAASLWRLTVGRALPLASAGWYVAAGTLGPIAALVVAYWRVTDFDRSISFALGAGLLAAVFVAGATQARRLETPEMDGVKLGLGALASAAVGALALGLTFALDKGMLTVAFALAALGTAWIAERTGIAALRYVVGGLGVIILGRLAWDPAIAGPNVGSTPIFNWLLWGYGVPAICFALASRILERGGRDRIVRLTECLALVFAYFLVIFQIRHLVHAGDPLALSSGHLEAGLTAAASLAFAWAVVRIEAGRPDIVTRIASLVFGAIGVGVSAVGLVVFDNPYLSGSTIRGGSLLNSLIPAYLLPAIAAAVLARSAAGLRPVWYVRAAGVLAFVLFFLYVVLEIRTIFQGPRIGLFRRTGEAELYTYSAAFLVIGVGLLAIGLIRDSRLLRQASSVFIVLTVVKVFLVDMANLEGVMRALSFIGLGLALVGIGFVYQRLLGRRAPPPSPAPGGAGE